MNYKDLLSSNIDILSYYYMLRNRAKRVKRITGVKTNKFVIGSACEEYFSNHLSTICMLDKYIWCIMNGRLMGIPFKFKLILDSSETCKESITEEVNLTQGKLTLTEFTKEEWERTNSIVNNEELTVWVNKIVKRIRKL